MIKLNITNLKVLQETINKVLPNKFLLLSLPRILITNCFAFVL
ncbi:hypothetical protein KL86DYS1_10134 [uncultured Dysgonomonas sp.]|uniref:Uncharacterized protein n=1 Tax=uncultured Dysgonomonas sp. TaxID=206096 RepID=A0A212ITW9_9BACT|nr:hypothetical protein KL86DYS1_10134 [uncultured Dysgonomonas sp.]